MGFAGRGMVFQNLNLCAHHTQTCGVTGCHGVTITISSNYHNRLNFNVSQTTTRSMGNVNAQQQDVRGDDAQRLLTGASSFDILCFH